MSDGQIYINHQAALSFADDMGPFNQQVIQIIDTLEAQLRSVVAQWEGADQEFYQQIQAKWNQETLHLGDNLVAYGRTLSDVSDHYRTAVNANVRNLEGIGF